MKYAQHRSQIHGKRARRLPIWPALIVVAIFISAVFIFLFGKDSGEELPPQQVIETELDNDIQQVQIMQEEVFFEEIALPDSGIARRGATGDLFTHVIVVDLPSVDTANFFYEGWLVNPNTLDFFSTGELFARQDGKWGLVYEVNEQDLDELKKYSQVVITLEPRDNDPAPASEHVLEADF